MQEGDRAGRRAGRGEASGRAGRTDQGEAVQGGAG